MRGRRKARAGQERGAGCVAVDRPLLLLLSSPSGGGKTTLARCLRADFPRMDYSVSCTTRAVRGKERNGVHYHFLGRGEFERRRKAGEFLEHAVVHGEQYGTLRATVRKSLRAGRDILLAIDVQGARQVRAAAALAPASDPLRRALVTVFLAPPSLAVLRERLERRGEDSPGGMARRLRNAAKELGCWREYDYLVVNDRLAMARAQLRSIVVAEHRRVRPSRASGVGGS